MFARFVAIALAMTSSIAFAQTSPPGYPANYAQTIAAANKEGKVVIYSALDTKADDAAGKHIHDQHHPVAVQED